MYASEIRYRGEQAAKVRDEEAKRRAETVGSEEVEDEEVREDDDALDGLVAENAPSLDEIYARELSSRLGMYCIRPYLKKLDDSTTADLDAAKSEGEVETTAVVTTKERTKAIASRLVHQWEVVKKQGEKGLLGLGCCFRRRKRKERLFGEVLADEREEKPKVRVNDTQRALVWYFGPTGVLKCPLVDGERLGRKSGVAEIEKGRGAFGAWRRKIKGIGLGISKGLAAAWERTMTQFHCLPGFETLE